MTSIGKFSGSLSATRAAKKKKKDLLWLIIMRGVKVRSVLKRWNYISNDNWPFCRKRETVEHCFFECERLETVWGHFLAFFNQLVIMPNLSFRNLVLFSGSPSDPKDIMTSYIIKSVLFEIWNSRNRATFSGKYDTAQITIQNANNAISFRLKLEFLRLRSSAFCKLWAVDDVLCGVSNGLLLINVYLSSNCI